MSVLSATGRTVTCHRQFGAQEPSRMVPVSAVTDWVVVNEDANTAQSGGQLSDIIPTIVATDTIKMLTIINGGTSVLVRATYTGAPSPMPTIRVYGIDSGFLSKNRPAIPMNLPDRNDGLALALTQKATDVIDENSVKYSDHVIVDARGAAVVTVFTSIAAQGAAGTVQLQAKVI